MKAFSVQRANFGPARNTPQPFDKAYQDVICLHTLGWVLQVQYGRGPLPFCTALHARLG